MKPKELIILDFELGKIIDKPSTKREKLKKVLQRRVKKSNLSKKK